MAPIATNVPSSPNSHLSYAESKNLRYFSGNNNTLAMKTWNAQGLKEKTARLNSTLTEVQYLQNKHRISTAGLTETRHKTTEIETATHILTGSFTVCHAGDPKGHHGTAISFPEGLFGNTDDIQRDDKGPHK